MNRTHRSWNNWLLVAGVLALAIAPLILVRGADFSGADGEAEVLIQETNPNYQPWVNPLFEPASSEVESLLFAVQAALGAGVIGYVIGLHRGRQTHQNQKRE
ncbi:energy-coupling factor ABC transporter substrate-binding protein [Oscillatoria sp. FACHB-1407]|uniref:energy-coupling factor ABC transporter substrate-binding protein n=1 Tax=Oscillatoria sp. FACHB-1407 TaxID=2692847 RepID=UPI0016883CDE|nr:energy-coupling factor ABC transporter substrate-binding protein [Oscillatoria sp. FACHB-1407]MBD2463691.1 energy-coupling factor ABC transporter substrate-binding protein [Oscillatoria sp. FACHB-1407]